MHRRCKAISHRDDDDEMACSPQIIGTLVGVDVIGILRLYGDDGGPPFVIKHVHGMCGHEELKVPVAIDDGKAFVDGAEYKLVLRGRGWDHWDWS